MNNILHGHKHKSYNQNLVNQTQQYRKRVIYCYIKLIPGVQNGFNIQKSIKILNYINKLKRKSHIKYMQKKYLTEIQHSSLIKLLSKPGIEKNFLHLTKGIYQY